MKQIRIYASPEDVFFIQEAISMSKFKVGGVYDLHKILGKVEPLPTKCKSCEIEQIDFFVEQEKETIERIKQNEEWDIADYGGGL